MPPISGYKQETFNSKIGNDSGFPFMSDDKYRIAPYVAVLLHLRVTSVTF